MVKVLAQEAQVLVHIILILALLACRACGEPETPCDTGQPEVCDGVDNNCDGFVDDLDPFLQDGTRFYQDLDRDTYGDANDDGALHCGDPGVGFSLNSKDCDDSDGLVYPDATQRCGEDADCDGEDDSLKNSTWYADRDRDGYGDPTTQTDRCGQNGELYISRAGDCDDGDAYTKPSAPELCDEKDNDCDGTVDNGAGETVAYLDQDGDGYGLAETTTTAECIPGAPPGGYSWIPGDCDDSSALFHPGAEEKDCADPNDYNCDGAVGREDGDGDGFDACEDCDDRDPRRSPAAAEICDQIDNNCDGLQDDADSMVLASTQLTWYADRDEDGYGDLSSTTLACEVPAGFTADTRDCDDSADHVYPGAEEVCDGVDDDCDGLSDDADPEVSSDSFFPWYLDTDGDGFGVESDTWLACAPPEGYAGSAQDCDDTLDNTYPGAFEVHCDGFAVQDCDATDTTECVWEDGLSQSELIWEERAGVFNAPAGEELLIGGAWLGVSRVGTYVDPDDYPDGHPCVDCSGVLLYELVDIQSRGDDSVELQPYATLLGAQTEGFAGSRLALGAWDLDLSDGDFSTEEVMAVGEPWVMFENSDSGEGCYPPCPPGSVYLLMGLETLVGEVSLPDTAIVQIDGDENRQQFGAFLDFDGDLNGDGLTDLVVGSPGFGMSPDRYRVYVFDGLTLSGLSGAVSASTYTSGVWEADGDRTGRLTSAMTEDFTGDGSVDLLLGAHAGLAETINGTQAFLVTAAPMDGGDLLATGVVDKVIYGAAGEGLALDLDADASTPPDLLIAGYPPAGADTGNLTLFLIDHDTLNKNRDLSLPADAWASITGDGLLYGNHGVPTDLLATAQADVDEDGLPDVLIGSKHAEAYIDSHGSERRAGALWVLRGSTLADLPQGATLSLDSSGGDSDAWILGDSTLETNMYMGESAAGIDLDGDLVLESVVLGLPGILNDSGNATQGGFGLLRGGLLE